MLAAQSLPSIKRQPPNQLLLQCPLLFSGVRNESTAARKLDHCIGSRPRPANTASRTQHAPGFNPCEFAIEQTFANIAPISEIRNQHAARESVGVVAGYCNI